MKYINLVNKYHISIQSPESHSHWYWLWILQDGQQYTHEVFCVCLQRNKPPCRLVEGLKDTGPSNEPHVSLSLS